MSDYYMQSAGCIAVKGAPFLLKSVSLCLGVLELLAEKKEDIMYILIKSMFYSVC